MRADNNQVTERSPQKRSTEEIVQSRKAHLIDLVGRRLGEALKSENLGAMAKTFLEEVAGPQIQKALQSETRAVPAKLAKRMADDLQDLVAKDRFLAAPPADADARPSVLDGRQIELVPQREKSTHAIAGAIDLGSHVLGDVLKQFDIKADGLTETMASALKVGLDRRADLANPKTWLSIVPQMAAAAMATKGPWQARVGAAAIAGVQGLASRPRVIDAPAVDASPTAQTNSTDTMESASSRPSPHMLGVEPSQRGGRVERQPGTFAGGILGLAQARTQSGDNRRLAQASRQFMSEVAELFGGDEAALNEISQLLASAASKGVGSQPRLIDASHVKPNEPVIWPQVSQQVEDFAHQVLGPEGLNINITGGNQAAAVHFLDVLQWATTTAEKETGHSVDLTKPQDQAMVLRVALANLAEVAPSAGALLSAYDAVSTTPSPESTDVFAKQMGRHQRKMTTSMVVEALSEGPQNVESFQQALKSVNEQLADVESQLEQSETPSPELANARITLKAQADALKEPSGRMADIVRKGGLAELQYPADKGMTEAGWARLARSSHRDAYLDAKSKFDVAVARQTVAPAAAQALASSSLATIWNVSAEAVGGVPQASSSVAGMPGGGGGYQMGGGGSIGGGSGGGGPNGPNGPNMPPMPEGGPGDSDPFRTADEYAASMGGRIDKRRAEMKQRDNFDDIRAILNDPALEFFDKIFLVMTMLIDRTRDKIEEDQIDQLDREEMMWINEQMAHEYQKEVELAQRDIHELGKEVDKAAGAFTAAERRLKQLEAMPAQERAPDHDREVAAAKAGLAEAKEQWAEGMGRFETRKEVLNELRDARDAHRVQIASDRRSADIFAAKVKRNTHVVEMYMDLIKTFEDHKQRNLQRMLS